MVWALPSQRRSKPCPDCCAPSSTPRPLELTRRAAFWLPFALAGCAGQVVEAPNYSRRALDATRLDSAQAVAWLNDYRSKSALGPISLDSQLVALAQAQADAMAAADKVSHDVRGSFSSRLAAAGLHAEEAGENVCAGYYSTEDAMEAWRRSPDHDANLRLKTATRFGVALAKNARSQWGAFWAMAIASPPAPEG